MKWNFGSNGVNGNFATNINSQDFTHELLKQLRLLFFFPVHLMTLYSNNREGEEWGEEGGKKKKTKQD